MKILLIGGGTGGHILPLVPLIRAFKAKNVQTEVIVADAPLDHALVEENTPNTPVHFFRTEKIRRYWSWKNLLAPFAIINSISRAKRMLKEINPDAIFLKGGFVGFPFLIATRFGMKKIPIFTHESDISAGSLNRLAQKWTTASFESFGTPPLPLFFSNPEKMTPPDPSSFEKKPKLLVIGGSLGAQWINEQTERRCHDICNKFDVLLISGRGKPIHCESPNFKQKELLPAAELTKELQKSDIVLSRAGANSLFEIIAAKKPSVIVPLPSAARNHQVKNAEWFAKKRLCNVLLQDEDKDILQSLLDALEDKEMQQALNKSQIKNAAEEIVEIMISKMK